MAHRLTVAASGAPPFALPLLHVTQLWAPWAGSRGVETGLRKNPHRDGAGLPQQLVAPAQLSLISPRRFLFHGSFLFKPWGTLLGRCIWKLGNAVVIFRPPMRSWARSCDWAPGSLPGTFLGVASSLVQAGRHAVVLSPSLLGQLQKRSLKGYLPVCPHKPGQPLVGEEPRLKLSLLAVRKQSLAICLT